MNIFKDNQGIQQQEFLEDEENYFLAHYLKPLLHPNKCLIGMNVQQRIYQF